jgi:hypothetical protein
MACKERVSRSAVARELLLVEGVYSQKLIAAVREMIRDPGYDLK